MRVFSVLAIGASVLALSAPASAGEWYVGVAGAYVDNQPETSHSVAPVSGGGWFTANNRASINAAAVDDLQSSSIGGALFGGYQGTLSGSITAGLEADVTFFDGSEAASVTTNYDVGGDYTISQDLSQSWLASLRARVGVDVGLANIFLTGGVAFTDYEFSGTFSDTYFVLGSRILAQGGSASGTESGFVYGAGVEFGAWTDVKVRAEYLHYDFGDVDGYSRTLTFSGGGPTTGPEVFSGRTSLESDSFRLGLVFKL